ncbi:MAG: hypothetical protein ABL879_01620 [Devosia sp.]
MPRYFFDFSDNDELFIDREGIELPDEEAAKRESSTIAADIARDHLAGTVSPGIVEVRIRDEAGNYLTSKAVHIEFDDPLPGATPDRVKPSPHLKR